MRLSVALWATAAALSISSADGAAFADLPWQQACDKHQLCRTLVQQHVLAVMRCARNPTCSTPEAVDCFAGQAYLLPFRCSAAECVEVASFAESISECNSWYPRMSLASKRWMQAALIDVRTGARSPNVSAPIAAERADFALAAGKGKGKKGP